MSPSHLPAARFAANVIFCWLSEIPEDSGRSSITQIINSYDAETAGPPSVVMPQTEPALLVACEPNETIATFASVPSASYALPKAATIPSRDNRQRGNL
jgi:hypothetical protein